VGGPKKRGKKRGKNSIRKKEGGSFKVNTVPDHGNMKMNRKKGKTQKREHGKKVRIKTADGKKKKGGCEQGRGGRKGLRVEGRCPGGK